MRSFGVLKLKESEGFKGLTGSLEGLRIDYGNKESSSEGRL
jgi:hypothetical protein